MRNKILAELIKKFSGLSHKFLGLIADKLAKKVTEESGIEQAITDYDNAVSIQDLAADFQKEGDKRVSDAKKEWDKKNPPKPEKPEDDPEDDDPEDEPDPKEKGKKEDKPKKRERIPAYAKAIMEEIKSLKDEKAKNTIDSKISELNKGEDGKTKINEKFLNKRQKPEKIEDIEAWFEEAQNDWKEIAGENSGGDGKKDDKTVKGHNPKRSNGKTDPAPTKEELDAIIT